MNDKQAIIEVVTKYFMGTFHGDKQQLQQAFHPEAIISGNLQGKNTTWSLAEFLLRVTTPPTAAEKKENYAKDIIWIDITNDCAVVKAQVMVGEFKFTDYISLLKIEDCWGIRYKSFTA